MKAKAKILGLMMTAVLIASSPMLVYADNGGGDKDTWHQDGDRHDGDHDRFLAKILNLSDDQVKQMNDNHQKDREAMKSIFDQIKTNREALDAEIIKANADTNKITTIATQIKALQAQILDAHLNSILAIKKILTPEQFAGYMTLKKAQKMMMHKKHDQFEHDGQGDKHWGDKDAKGHDEDQD